MNYLRDGKIVHGGEQDAKDLFLAPTLLTEVLPEAPVMQEEIFGPILPVLEFDDLDDALALLRARADAAGVVSVHPRPRDGSARAGRDALRRRVRE